MSEISNRTESASYKPWVMNAVRAFPAVVIAAGVVAALVELVPDSARLGAGLAAGAIFVALIYWRAFGIAIAVDQDGVLIRNFFWSGDVPWSAIDEIEIVVQDWGSQALSFRAKEQRGGSLLTRAWSSTATASGGGREKKAELLSVLKHYASGHGIPCEVELRDNGTFRRAGEP